MFSDTAQALSEKVMPRHVLFTCIPGGPSHNAVKHRFQSQCHRLRVGPCIGDENGQIRRMIFCSYEDNALFRRTEPHYMSNIETACEG